MGGTPSEEWKGYQHQLLSDKKQRGVFIEGTEEKGATAILRRPTAKDGLLGFLKDENGNDQDTAWKLFQKPVRTCPKNEYIGYRTWVDPENSPGKRGPYKWITYEEFGAMVDQLGCGMRKLGIADKSNIGIFSQNRPEWFLAHLANLSQCYRTTALYDTLGPDAVSYIVNHAEVPIVFTEKNKLKTLFTALADAKKKAEEEKDGGFKVKYVVQIDYQASFGNGHEKVDEDDVKTAQADLGVELIGLSALLDSGKGCLEEFKGKFLPTKEDVAYIMYTSGTTGNPKGVVLSHQAFAATVATASRGAGASPEDVHLSYLPLAHIFEACTSTFVMSQGAKVAYFQGNIKLIGEDWKDVRPTILVGVPRVFGKTYDRFKSKVSKMGSVQKWVVESVQSSSARQIRAGKRSTFYDKYVWSSIAEEIGFDRVRITLSGAAPLPPHIAEFLRIILPKSAVMQGYGLTECCAAGTMQDQDDITLGTVGPPTDVTEVRLVDAPECGYMTTDEPHPRGEIQLRGLNIMNGYFKNDEATTKVLDKETGWFSTGDIGRINPNGTLSIIDRRKNLFKTSTGEYIAVEKVEITYLRASTVGQMWIYGNSYKSFVVAIIVPEAQVLTDILKEKQLWTADDAKLQVASPEYNARFKEVCEKNKEQIKKIVLADLKSVEGDLKRFERVKDIDFEFEIDEMLQGFNVANNCMTPTFKLKRPQLLGRYVDAVKALYAANGEPPNEDENWIKK